MKPAYIPALDVMREHMMRLRSIGCHEQSARWAKEIAPYEVPRASVTQLALFPEGLAVTWQTDHAALAGPA